MPYYPVVYLMCRDAGNPAKTGGSTLNIIDVNAGITVTLDITVVYFYCFGYQHGKGCYMKNDGGQVVGEGCRRWGEEKCAAGLDGVKISSNPAVILRVLISGSFGGGACGWRDLGEVVIDGLWHAVDALGVFD